MTNETEEKVPTYDRFKLAKLLRISPAFVVPVSPGSSARRMRALRAKQRKNKERS